MATYCVAFRVSNITVDGKTYGDRCDALMKNLGEGSDGFWTEPTSFALVAADDDIATFAQKAVRGLSSERDMVFVFDPADMSACYFGRVSHPDALHSFFPAATKV